MEETATAPGTLRKQDCRQEVSGSLPGRPAAVAGRGLRMAAAHQGDPTPAALLNHFPTDRWPLCGWRQHGMNYRSRFRSPRVRYPLWLHPQRGMRGLRERVSEAFAPPLSKESGGAPLRAPLAACEPTACEPRADCSAPKSTLQARTDMTRGPKESQIQCSNFNTP